MSFVQKLQNKLGGKDIKSIMKGGASSFLIRIFGLGLSYILILIITNQLGAAVYGDYVFFTTSVNLLAILVVFGMDTFMLRSVSKSVNYQLRRTYIRRLFAKGFSTIVLLSLPVSMLLLLFNEQLSSWLEVSPMFVWGTALVLLPMGILKINREAFRGFKKIKTHTLYRDAVVPGFSILIISLLLFTPLREKIEEAGIPLLAFGAAVCIACLSSLFFLLKTNRRSSNDKTADKEIWTDELEGNALVLLQKAFPFLLTASLMFLGQRIDILMIKAFRTSAELGVYNVCFRIAMLASLPIAAINAITAPTFSELYGKRQIERLKKVVKQASLLILLVSAPVLAVLLLLPGFVISMFGSEFDSGILALRLILVGHVMNVITGPVGWLLQMTDRQHVFMRIVIIATLTNVVLNALLIPYYGIEGAAIASLVSLVLQNSLAFLSVRKHLGFSTQYFLK